MFLYTDLCVCLPDLHCVWKQGRGNEIQLDVARELGKGGWGRVFLGRRTQGYGGNVAIKAQVYD